RLGAGAGRDGPRPVVRRPGLRRAGDRDDVRLSRHGQADLRRGDGQRLQPRPRRAAAGDGGDAVRQFRRRPRLCLARPAGVVFVKGPLVLLALIAAAALAGPFLGDPSAVDLADRLAGPSLAHPLGTDELGRDMLLRLLEGGRISLAIGVAAAAAAAAVGLVSGYLGGWVDRILMRLVDAVIALPLLPLLIVLAALDLTKLGVPPRLAHADGIGLVRIVCLAVLIGWTTAARLVRGATLIARNRDFVRAARSLGAGVPHILVRHILPNVLAPLVVATSLSVADVILL